jgi:hypothetical protein
MAKVHVLDTHGEHSRLILHVDVPAGNNSVGTAWTAVLVNSGIGGQTRLPDGSGTGGTISAAEKSSIQAGTVFEVEDRVRIPAGMTMGQANAFFDALHAAKVTEVQAWVQARLNFFGFVRT